MSVVEICLVLRRLLVQTLLFSLQCGKKTVSCHRVVLACISRYFRTMFTSDMKECKNEKITINDIDDHALVSLINFAYTAKIKITVDNVQSLLYASSILQVETVANACSDFMESHLDPPNCIGVYTFATHLIRNRSCTTNVVPDAPVQRQSSASPSIPLFRPGV